MPVHKLDLPQKTVLLLLVLLSFSLFLSGCVNVCCELRLHKYLPDGKVLTETLEILNINEMKSKNDLQAFENCPVGKYVWWRRTSLYRLSLFKWLNGDQLSEKWLCLLTLLSEEHIKKFWKIEKYLLYKKLFWDSLKNSFQSALNNDYC